MIRGQRALEVLVYAMMLVAVSLVGRQLWTTDLDFDTLASGDRLVVSAVDPGGAAERAGLIVGDVLVERPGLAIIDSNFTERELYQSNAALGRAMASGHVPVRVERAGHAVVVDVIPLPAPRIRPALRQLRRMASDLPTAFAFLGVAILLARARSFGSEEERARRTVAAAFALLGPAWTVEWPSPGWPQWLYPVASFLDVFTAGAGVLLLLRFAWSFPTRSKIVDQPFLRWALVVVGVACAALSSLNTLSLIDAPPKLHGNAVVILFDSAIAVAIVVGLVWQRARAKDVVARRQAAWLIGSVGIGFFVPILALLVPKHVFGIGAPILDTVLFPFPLLVPVTFAAVVARYRLFALDGFVLRLAPYVITIVTSLLVCLLITLGLQAAFEWRTGTSADAVRWFGVLAALVIAEPMRRAAQAFIDRVFGRDREAFIRQCSELAAKLSGAVDARAIENAVQMSLDAKTVRMFGLDHTLTPAAARAVRSALAKSGVARVLDLREPAAFDALHSADLEIVVAIPQADASTAATHALGLTLPRAAERLDRTEADALVLVGRVIGASLAESAARSALVGEIRRAEDERKHIAMELHDGLGATLAAASLMTRNLRARSPSASDTTLDALDAALREGLGDLRVSLWSLDPGQSSWEALVARMRRQTRDMCDAANVEIRFAVDGEPPCDVSASKRLAILRVVQQASSNALEHGSPRTVYVSMTISAGVLSLVVADDGVGIAPDAPLGRGLGNMVRRIEGSGGTCHVRRREPSGTEVAVTLPLRA